MSESITQVRASSPAEVHELARPSQGLLSARSHILSANDEQYCLLLHCTVNSGANQVEIQLRRQAKSVFNWGCSVGIHRTSTFKPWSNQSKLWCLADEPWQNSAFLLDTYLWSDP